MIKIMSKKLAKYHKFYFYFTLIKTQRKLLPNNDKNKSQNQFKQSLNKHTILQILFVV